jgi:glucan 1,3-beta-glucosidase
VENLQSIVLVSGGATILPGSTGAVTIKSWDIGPRYTTVDGIGGPVTGYVSTKTPNLLNGAGRLFTRSKPQY